MNKKISLLLACLILFSIALSACGGPLTPVATQIRPTAEIVTTKPAPTPVPVTVQQPYEIRGDFTYSNDLITTYYVEQSVALVDMYGFVKRDKEWLIPVSSQTLGYLKIDTVGKTGSYTLQLPAKPTGTLVDVDNNNKTDQGLQIFAVTYQPNLTGGPYSEGNDPSYGWPNYLASVRTDTENDDEILNGSLVIWAPDSNQQFPTSFGADKKLFTPDDPAGPVPAGYSIVNMDQEPFSVTTEAQPKLSLFEPKDIVIKDFGADSYTQAFDKMFKIVKKEYAFNGIQGKQPDWDKLYATLKPRVEESEKKNDPMGYYLALRDFTWAFKDGHVGLGGSDLATQDFNNFIQGGYGFTIRELDNGQSIAIYVLNGGPAAETGMQVGALVTEFNGEPIKDAISAAHAYSQQSSDFAIRYQQARYLLRAAPGTEASVTFINPQAQPKTAKLSAVAETNSFRRASIYFGVDTSSLVPVDFKIIDSQIGYIRINSNYDDLGLIIRLFQRALEKFKAGQVKGIIIDMRYNSGGANLGLAGFLTGNTIPMGQLEYYSDTSGKFEPKGLRGKVLPNQEQYSFDKMVLLVGQACYSACELESYAFSQVPGMQVVGLTPTGGVEAEVARGQFKLPENLSLQIPTGRFTLADGSLFLEGLGVPPTIRVPMDEKNALSTEDIVLQSGIDTIMKLPGQGIVPSAPPTLLNIAGIQDAINARAKQLEELANEKYTNDDMAKMDGVFTYTIPLTKSETLIWAWGWCAKDQASLDEDMKNIKLEFRLESVVIPLDKFLKKEGVFGDQTCRYFIGAVSDWKGGENHLSTTVDYTASINDGSTNHPAGKQIFNFVVYAQP
ncbi:MAG: S41 family peptidase [Chloroflexi bacterium]|nr:S41 family peptidase [Chloroflexota bacterium]